MRFSIIIPFKAVNAYLRETVPYVLQLNSPDWELILVPNEDMTSEWPDPRIRVIASGRVGPGAKRDMAAKVAQGEILVFLDDDSYPEADLLDVAQRYFADPGVVALGGPGITPPQDGFWQRVSGAVFLSRLSGGAPERYVPVGGVREIHDWPSVNLMVRKADFLSIGGFDSDYWPGEDTKLCLDLVKKTGRKILYIPEMIVWHHRRAGLLGHLKQIGAYGLHRGFFVKEYPETSRKFAYFLPSAFVVFVLTSLGAWFMPSPLRAGIAFGWALYAAALLKALRDILTYEDLSVAVCALGYTVCTHLYYGVRFLQGLVLTRRLVSALR